MAIERNNSFHLLLSDDELKLLKLLAEKEGLNASDYLRMLIRTMPNPSPHLRFPAAVGRADMAKLFETYAEAIRQSQEPKAAAGGDPKRRKAK
jgi:hypothetical protein